MNPLHLIFGSRNNRILKKYNKIINKINSLEPEIERLTDDEIISKTKYFKETYKDEKDLDLFLPEAFALVREVIKRKWGKRLYDVQMIGGIILHHGKISEMKTGEGKTFTAALPAYLNALSGKGVHIITVNDYLAERDAEKMGEIFSALGLTTGCNLSKLALEEKIEIYNCDITYGTNSEFGFDYLRDNMALDKEERSQRPLNYAIIDEVDSILIDEARTPLIISGPADEKTEVYNKMNTIPPKLVEGKIEGDKNNPIETGDFIIDKKEKRVSLTERGHEKVELLLSEMGLISEGTNLYDSENISLLHHLSAALKAHFLFHRDTHYVVRDGEILIVDEFTGRILDGRRWNDSIHQAIESKEGVEIKEENVTLATITLQNYFKQYHKLAGMTGTADTEAFEFNDIYNLETVVVPTNRPLLRKDTLDEVYISREQKDKAILRDIKSKYEKGQPVLIGTSSIDNNEYYSELLKKENIPHQVLNAKQHEKEAYVISQAGRKGMITIATNMAGRGTDIILGGNIEQDILNIRENNELTEEEKENAIQGLEMVWQKEHDEVVALGGLHVIGTERHESRRIDNQFRGRSGRQGDPGSTRFYLSLEDPLLQIFSGEKVINVLKKMQVDPESALTHPFMSKTLENAQRKIENHNYNIRKQLLDFDNVSNEQRHIIYRTRKEILESDDMDIYIKPIRDNVFYDVFTHFVKEGDDNWDLEGLNKELSEEFNLHLPLEQWAEENPVIDDFFNKIIEHIDALYKEKEDVFGVENFKIIQRKHLLDSIDIAWREHLSSLAYLRKGIHLRGFAQKDPKQEYKKEAFSYFGNMIDSFRFDAIKKLTWLHPVKVENQNIDIIQKDDSL